MLPQKHSSMDTKPFNMFCKKQGAIKNWDRKRFFKDAWRKEYPLVSRILTGIAFLEYSPSRRWEYQFLHCSPGKWSSEIRAAKTQAGTVKFKESCIKKLKEWRKDKILFILTKLAHYSKWGNRQNLTAD